MDDARRVVLLAEYEDAKRDLEELKGYVATLGKRLGIAGDDNAADPQTGAAAAPATAGRPPDNVLDVVYENEFHGQRIPRAAEMVVRRWSPAGFKRPIKTTSLLQALRKGGLTIESTRALYRALYTSPRFHNVPGSLWGLAEWYPASARTKGSKTSAPENGGDQEHGDDPDAEEPVTPAS